MVRPRFVIKISLPICFCCPAFVIRNLYSLSSRMFLARDESNIMFFDCFRARFKFRSNLSGLFVNGDLISYSTPSSRISAVFRLVSGKNSTICPAAAKISATRNSCGQGLRPAGIMIRPFFVDFFMPPL